MDCKFSTVLSELRHKKELSQRKLASELHISQALLSHYENGTREPGLPFICRVCDYFGVPADYLLGRSDDPSALGALAPALSEFGKQLLKATNPSACEAALDYLDAAARRIGERLSGSDNDLFFAEQNAKMSGAELRLIQINKKY